MASCVGILVQYLAERPELQQGMRQQPGLLPAAIDEILRMHAPLIANRRIVRKDVEIADDGWLRATVSPLSGPRPIATNPCSAIRS
jgi:cytochrome P450